MGYLAYIDRPGAERETVGVKDESDLLSLIRATLLTPITEISIEPAHECDNCDGKGRNTGWPHTKCPTCEGHGYEPGEAP